MKTTFTVEDDKKTLLMERTFSAPQHRLWQAYSEKELFEQWFAPAGWEVKSTHFDFRDGGENHYVMTCVDKNQGEWYGKESAGKMVYEQVHPKSAFSYRDYFLDEEGNVMIDMPSSISNLELIDNGDETTTLRVKTVYETEEALKTVLEMGMKEGYEQTLDKLEAIITS